MRDAFSSRYTSRRRFLQAATGVVLGALLAACGRQETIPRGIAATVTPAPTRVILPPPYDPMTTPTGIPVRPASVVLTLAEGTNLPGRFAFDQQGNVYVTEFRAQRVWVLSHAGQSLRYWGSRGTGKGEFVFVPVGIAPTYGLAHAIAVDRAGLVYVGDSTGRVQVFDANGQFLRTWGAVGDAPGQFNFISGMAFDASDTLHVVDRDNHRIQLFTTAGDLRDVWGERGMDAGEFYAPRDIAIDRNGRIFVADTGNNRIQRFDANRQYVGEWGQYAPYGIAVDARGDVYVADYHSDRIQKFTDVGQFLTTWDRSGNMGVQVSMPVSLRVDTRGYVWVAEPQNGRIQVFAQ